MAQSKGEKRSKYRVGQIVWHKRFGCYVILWENIDPEAMHWHAIAVNGSQMYTVGESMLRRLNVREKGKA